MSNMPPERATGLDPSRLLVTIAELELEVDRLRRHGTFLEQEATATLTSILRLGSALASDTPVPTLAEVQSAARSLLEIVKDLRDLPGEHSAHDQVVSIAVRPLALQVFRWQQRLNATQGVELRLELDTDHVEWFPARFRHILDNLLSHALRNRDPAITSPWVSIGLQTSDDGYELRLSGNGSWTISGEERRNLELFHRALVPRGGLAAGLPVVRLLAEQSGGMVVLDPREEGGTDVVLTLPRYDLLDYLE